MSTIAHRFARSMTTLGLAVSVYLGGGVADASECRVSFQTCCTNTIIPGCEPYCIFPKFITTCSTPGASYCQAASSSPTSDYSKVHPYFRWYNEVTRTWKGFRMACGAP